MPAGGAVHAPGGTEERATVAASVPQRGKRRRTAASTTLDPATIEAVLLAALESPAVEKALVDLFARTMSKAVLRAGTRELRLVPGQLPRQSPTRHVLLAGVPEAQQEALKEALGTSFEVRSWKPARGPQSSQTLARLCKTVAFPGEADDEVDASLRNMDVRVIRRAGNASRLIERIGELG